MRLNAKAALIIAGTSFGLLAAVYVVSQLVVLDSFRDLETREATEETERAGRWADSHLADMSSTAQDWAGWDDTYYFVQGDDDAYVDANISADVFTNLGIEVMAFLDGRGDLVYGAQLDQEQGEIASVSPDWSQSLSDYEPALLFADLEASAAGVMQVGNQQFLAAAQPVTRSDGSGPIAGTLVMATPLDDTFLAQLAPLVGHTLTLQPLDVPPDPLRQELSPSSPVVTGVQGDEVVGYALLSDIQGQPAVALRLDMERVIFAEGQSTAAWMLGAVIVSGLAFAAVIIFLLNRVILSRLSTMRAGVKDIAASSNPRGRLVPQGRDEIGDVAASVNHLIDVIEGGEAALADSRERWRALVEYSHDLILVMNSDLTVAFVNAVIEPMLGYKPADFLGTDALVVVHPDDVQKTNAVFAQVAAGLAEPCIAEARMRRADGSYAHVEGIPSRIRWGDHDAILLNARDVTAQKQAQDTIAYMAYHDSLTSLPNRLLLQDRLDIAIAQARRSGSGVCVVSLDVDRFKNVNDALGHNAGDDLLQQVAKRLTGVVRDGDTVARIGGDEFILVFPECPSLVVATDGTRRIIEAFRRPFRVAEREIHVTVSAGLATFPEHGSEGETLVNNADMALYIAKDAGRNTYRAYSDDMGRRSAEWFAMEGQLRQALINGEIAVYYQPQLRVDSGEVIGAEALARWHHPERGIIMPAEFITLAEETGLINLLGDIVLREACVEAVTWPEPLRIAVNVSLRQFEREDFVERVLASVRETGLDPDRLELEITESTALRDIERTREIADKLIDAGIHLSIDDFGTGSTSLRHLQHLPLHQVKIDQSFILTLLENPANAAIAASVISLGHRLNLNVIAEGVETDEQLQFLREQHCDEFQGFLVSKPVPPDQFRKMLAERSLAMTAPDPA